jgi:acyl-CoA synthetase (AMP-forming)/AMP-acid ligase II
VRVDEEGVLWFVDRKKDMIKSGGENIYCSEVEAVLRQHPALAEGVVIGLPDERWGEAVTAVVQLHPEAMATEAEIIAWCREYLPGYRCPKAVKFVAAYPRSAVSKILKRELRELYIAELAGNAGA